MDELNVDRNDFECVEPALGDEMWRFEAPDLDASLRRRLENHLMICDACRLRQAMDRRVASGLEDGTLELQSGRAVHPRRLAIHALGWSGGLAVAASLVLMLLVPPQARNGGRLVRSADDTRFLRPVEGEVINGGQPRLSWEPVPGATNYRLTVSEVGGDHEWHGETTALSLVVPAAAELPPSRSFRASLEPVPADLAQPGGVSVSFSTGDLSEFLAYRLAASSTILRLLGLAGLFMLVNFIVLRVTRR
ncbi:MAG: hypothetical protein ABFS42_07640 [Candidatus Krumholzibacteriota bacterium]